jgi:hypothetical protein
MSLVGGECLFFPLLFRGHLLPCANLAVGDHSDIAKGASETWCHIPERILKGDGAGCPVGLPVRNNESTSEKL